MSITPSLPSVRVRGLAAEQHGVVSVSQAGALGLSHDDIGAAVRRGEYRRLWLGVLLVDADMYDDVPWLTRVQAALLRHGPQAVVGLGSAAQLLGIAGADTSSDVIDIVLPRGNERQQVQGISLHTRELPPTQVLQLGSFRVTTAVRTLADLVPHLPRNCAVAAMDSALNHNLITGDDLLLARELTARRRNCPVSSTGGRLLMGERNHRWKRGQDSTVWITTSRQKSLQWKVRDDAGYLLGLGDMAWTKRRHRPLVAEADGVEPHSLPGAVFKDRRRGNNFIGANVDVVRLTWAEALRRGRCAAIVRMALNAGSGRRS